MPQYFLLYYFFDDEIGQNTLKLATSAPREPV